MIIRSECAVNGIHKPFQVTSCVKPWTDSPRSEVRNNFSPRPFGQLAYMLLAVPKTRKTPRSTSLGLTETERKWETDWVVSQLLLQRNFQLSFLMIFFKALHFCLYSIKRKKKKNLAHEMGSQCLHRWKPWEALNDFSRKLLGRGVVCFLTVPLHISRKNLFKFCVRKWNRITALPLSWRRSQQHSFPAAMLECCKVIPFFLSPFLHLSQDLKLRNSTWNVLSVKLQSEVCSDRTHVLFRWPSRRLCFLHS